MCVRWHLTELRSGTRKHEINSRFPSFHRLLHRRRVPDNLTVEVQCAGTVKRISLELTVEKQL
jgi:hypothetical protein